MKNDYCLYSGPRGRKFEFLTPNSLLYKPAVHIVILSILLKKKISLQVVCWVSIELLGNYSHSSVSWGVEVKYELWLLYCPSNSNSQTRSLLLLVTPAFMQIWPGSHTWSLVVPSLFVGQHYGPFTSTQCSAQHSMSSWKCITGHNVGATGHQIREICTGKLNSLNPLHLSDFLL